ncbi:putative ribonuclease H-like domain-containing protein [Tanacetum coccineum]
MSILFPTTRIHKDHLKTRLLETIIQLLKHGELINFSEENANAKIIVRNKARLVAQGYTKEEGIDYDEVFAHVARIEAIRLFLAYASFMGFIVYQMDVKSAFYMVEKALYGLHQAPRAWYETLSTYLLENRFRRGTIDKTLFIKKDKGDILLVQVYVDDIIFGSTKKSLCVEFEQMMHKRFQMSSMGELTFFLGLQVKQKDDGIFISQDKYVADILKKFDFVTVKTTSTPIETNKALLKDEEAEDVDVHLYRSMIGSLMYLTASRPDIMFAVCACARSFLDSDYARASLDWKSTTRGCQFLGKRLISWQYKKKTIVANSNLHAVKRIFRYLKGQPKLGLWYPRDSPFDLEAFSDSDYARASLDRKSTTRGCQFLGKRLISWQCKKQTIVANSTTEAEYVAAANCYGQVLWIQNQMLGYGFNFMNTKIYIDNESTICIVKNPVFHSKTKHIEIRHHFIRDSYEKRLIQVIKIHTDHNVADLLTKAFDVSRISGEFGVKTSGCKVKDLVLLGEKKLEGNADFHKIVDFLTASTMHYALTNSVPIPNVADKAVFKEWDDKVVRATTTAASLDATQASGNTPGSDEERFEQDDLTDFVPPTPYNSPLSGGHTPRSDEGRPNITELMAIYTNLSNRVLALEQSKTAQDLVIRKLKKKVRKLEKNLRARTTGMTLFKIGTSKRKSLDKENVSKQGRKSDKTKLMFNDSDFVELDMKNVKGDAETQGRNTAKQITTAEDTVNTASIDVSAAGPSNVSTAEPSTSTAGDIFEDKMMTIADTLVAIRSTRPRTTSIMVEPEPTPKNPIKTQIQRDAKIAQKLFEEEQAQFERVQRIAREKATEQEAKDAALIEQMEDLQARIDADELLAERLQQEEREQFTIEEKSRMLVEMIAERKRFFAAQRTEQIRNKPPTRTQLRNKIITYLKNIGRFTHNQLKNRSLEEIQMLYEKEQKWIDDFVPMDSELEVQRLKRAGQEVLEEPVKRQKIREASGSGKEQSAEKEKELSEEELQKLLVVVLVEEVYVEALQVKYPIIDWEVYSEDTRRYWKIIRVGNHT